MRSILLFSAIFLFLQGSVCPRPAPIVQDGSGCYPPKKESGWKAKERKITFRQPWTSEKKKKLEPIPSLD